MMLDVKTNILCVLAAVGVGVSWVLVLFVVWVVVWVGYCESSM